MDYFEQLCAAMRLVSEHPRAIFLGQAVAMPGTAMSRTFRDVPREKLLEMPVAEDMQMGMAIGMALRGALPVCCYPRWSFLILALNQLVLHLDKLPLYSAYRPRVIVRVGTPTKYPIDPQAQHIGDFTYPVRRMLQMVRVESLPSISQIVPAYEFAMKDEGHSTLLVEYLGMY